MEEITKIIKEYEDKLFKIFKRNIDAKVIECKAYNYDAIKTYIEIRKIIIALEEEIQENSGLNQINDELIYRVIEYTDEYMNEAVNEFQRRAEQLLNSSTLDELIDGVDELKKIMAELKSVDSESISEGVAFQKNQNHGIIYVKKEGV